MRFDYYDILPEGMKAYMSHHGHHFSKPMLDWAVGMMEDRNGKKIQVPAKEMFEDLMKTYGLKLKRTEGYYDPLYVWCMAKADYWGSSITDEAHLVAYITDYIDDVDGNKTRAFDEFIANCYAKGVDIPWEDLI